MSGTLQEDRLSFSFCSRVSEDVDPYYFPSSQLVCTLFITQGPILFILRSGHTDVVTESMVTFILHIVPTEKMGMVQSNLIHFLLCKILK